MFQNGLIGLQLGGGNLGAQGGGGKRRRPQGQPLGAPGMGGMPGWGGGGKPGGMQPRPFEGGMNWQGQMPSVNQGGMQNGLLSMFGGQNPFWGQMRQY